VGAQLRLEGIRRGQLVTDSKLSTAEPYSYQVRSTGPDGSLPFFEEKPWIMSWLRLRRGSGCLWHLCTQVLTASGPIHPRLSLWHCLGAVVNLFAGQPTNPRTIMGRQGVFSPYPSLPARAFGPFTARRVPQGVTSGRGARAPPNMMGRRDMMKAVIMAVVGVEAPVLLPLPSPIISALGRSAAVTLFRLPALFISLLTSSQAAPSSAPFPCKSSQPHFTAQQWRRGTAWM
jgi:hypothetical protein